MFSPCLGKKKKKQTSMYPAGFYLVKPFHLLNKDVLNKDNLSSNEATAWCKCGAPVPLRPRVPHRRRRRGGCGRGTPPPPGTELCPQPRRSPPERGRSPHPCTPPSPPLPGNRSHRIGPALEPLPGWVGLRLDPVGERAAAGRENFRGEGMERRQTPVSGGCERGGEGGTGPLHLDPLHPPSPSGNGVFPKLHPRRWKFYRCEAKDFG